MAAIGAVTAGIMAAGIMAAIGMMKAATAAAGAAREASISSMATAIRITDVLEARLTGRVTEAPGMSHAPSTLAADYSSRLMATLRWAPGASPGKRNAMNVWQPISTAPEDETEILLWDSGPEHMRVGWHAFGYKKNTWIIGYDEQGEILADNPTHWMLPEPPQ